jgi:hypothetical protein
MTVLLGPADADHFRVKIGRYGDRWYADPLPACDIAPATDEAWPSISTVKKGSGSDWSFVALQRVAKALEADPARLANLDYGGRYDALKSINQRGLEAAAQRGTNVHLRCEAKLRGYPGILIPDGAPGTNYFSAVDAFFDQYQPELVVAEYVTVHRTLNGVGYGGTPDAIVRIDGGLYAIDWKSRGEDSSHGAYPEEGAQIAAGAFAEYMIVEGDHGPERRRLPKLDGGLVVSIKPDGCRVYPVDLDKAWEHYQNMHAWWVARRSERDSIGKPWAPKKSKTVAASAETATAELPPAALPDAATPKNSAPSSESATSSGTSSGSPDADRGVMIRTDASPSARATTIGEGSSPPTPTPAEQHAALRTSPDEGGPGDAGAFLALEKRYMALDDAARRWIANLVGEAQRHGVEFHARDHKTVRRFELVRAAVMLAETQPDDESLRAILHSVVGDIARFPSVATGHAVDAATFAQRVDTFINGTVPCIVTADGVVTLEFAA